MPTLCPRLLYPSKAVALVAAAKVFSAVPKAGIATRVTTELSRDDGFGCFRRSALHRLYDGGCRFGEHLGRRTQRPVVQCNESYRISCPAHIHIDCSEQWMLCGVLSIVPGWIVRNGPVAISMLRAYVEGVVTVTLGTSSPWAAKALRVTRPKKLEEGYNAHRSSNN